MAGGSGRLCSRAVEWCVLIVSRESVLQSSSNQMTLKEMEVCPICGSFLVVNDIPQRVEEHVSGKQHMGYAKVRETIDSLKVSWFVWLLVLLIDYYIA